MLWAHALSIPSISFLQNSKLIPDSIPPSPHPTVLENSIPLLCLILFCNLLFQESSTCYLTSICSLHLEPNNCCLVAAQGVSAKEANVVWWKKAECSTTCIYASESQFPCLYNQHVRENLSRSSNLSQENLRTRTSWEISIVLYITQEWSAVLETLLAICGGRGESS